MNVLLFGATGMIGHGALNAALADPRVEQVLTVGRRPTERRHPKLDELVVADLYNLADEEDRLADYDACLFCLGVSSAGMKETEYRRITYDLTLAVARVLVRASPAVTFVYVSGTGTRTDSKQMWARVKGETEKALSALPFRAVYHARPGFVLPVGGAVSRTALYRALYAVTAPLYPLLKRIVPNAVIDSDALGRALLEAGLTGAPNAVLEASNLVALAYDADGTPSKMY